jgi:hypothetical protein
MNNYFKIGALSVFLIIGMTLQAQKAKVLPSKVLDLTNWKITLPFDAEGNDGENSMDAVEVKRPAFDTLSVPTYFCVNEAGDGVIFRAHVNGAHTKGSGFPRSELREMTENGKKSAKWQSNTGKHTMEVDGAITHLPITKKHVVIAQIHSTGDFDDVITVRLEDRKLFLSHNGVKATMLSNAYKLGTRFKVKFVVENNVISTYYNDSEAPVEEYKLEFPDSYFKAGCYTQSASWGKQDKTNASDNEYGEVVLYNVKVTHE